MPLEYDEGEGTVLPSVLAHPPPYHRARAPVLYNDIARAIVSGLKFNDRSDLAKLMATWMVRAAAPELKAADIIVSVPLHRLRLLQRRSNQAAEISRWISRFSQRPYSARALIRTRSTPRQVGLGQDQRKRNVQGAFKVPVHWVAAVREKRVVLVDDVLTTGATVSAATQALKRAGAEDVTVLTFAMVPDVHI